MRSRASEIPAASSHRAHVRACATHRMRAGAGGPCVRGVMVARSMLSLVALRAAACAAAAYPLVPRPRPRSIDPPPAASASLPARLDRSSTGQTLRRPPPNGDLPLPLPFSAAFCPPNHLALPPQTSPRRDPSPPRVSVSPLGFTLLKHLVRCSTDDDDAPPLMANQMHKLACCLR
jgi:hypothetical protein